MASGSTHNDVGLAISFERERRRKYGAAFLDRMPGTANSSMGLLGLLSSMVSVSRSQNATLVRLFTAFFEHRSKRDAAIALAPHLRVGQKGPTCCSQKQIELVLHSGIAVLRGQFHRAHGMAED